MTLDDKDRQYLATLFSKLADGGAEAATATRLLNEKAASLGISTAALRDLFMRSNTLSNSLAVARPQQGLAVPAPRPSAPPRPSAMARPSVTATAKVAGAGTHRLAYVIDATGSREATWQSAQEIQAGLFQRIEHEAGKTLGVRITYFRGNDECTSSPWFVSADQLIHFMSAVRCEAGVTQIAKALAVYVEEQNVKAICLIGDAAEDGGKEIEAVAKQLGTRGTRVFCFLEGKGAIAEKIFRMIATVSGGGFSHFSSKADLADLCKFVATFATQGTKAATDLALAKTATPSVKRLAAQLALTHQKGK